MSLTIDWRAVALGEERREAIGVLDASLMLTWRADILVDAAWQLTAGDPYLSPLAELVKAYLHSPQKVDLRLSLLAPNTLFRQRVWLALLAIPVGTAVSYGQLAQQLASGSRAVANACRDNPYAGLIPCHRVVAKHGIGGFMGHRDGDYVRLKQQLLAFEQSIRE